MVVMFVLCVSGWLLCLYCFGLVFGVFVLFCVVFLVCLCFGVGRTLMPKPYTSITILHTRIVLSYSHEYSVFLPVHLVPDAPDPEARDPNPRARTPEPEPQTQTRPRDPHKLKKKTPGLTPLRVGRGFGVALGVGFGGLLCLRAEALFIYCWLIVAYTYVLRWVFY